MTDKQIIIDGVDVGWCKNYNNANSKDCETLYICNKNPNCYYKQLKRAEQECERLKETFDGLFKVQYKLADNNKKLRQCLTEIKEIAEIAVNFCKGCGGEDYECIDCTNGGRAQISEEILQKISEVEDD